MAVSAPPAPSGPVLRIQPEEYGTPHLRALLENPQTQTTDAMYLGSDNQWHYRTDNRPMEQLPNLRTENPAPAAPPAQSWIGANLRAAAVSANQAMSPGSENPAGALGINPPDPNRNTFVGSVAGEVLPVAAVAAANPGAAIGMGIDMGVQSAKAQGEAEHWTPTQTAVTGTTRAAFNSVMALIPGSKVGGGLLKSIIVKVLEAEGINVASSVVDNKLRVDMGLKGETDQKAFVDALVNKEGWAQSALWGLIGGFAHQQQTRSTENARDVRSDARQVQAVPAAEGGQDQGGQNLQRPPGQAPVNAQAQQQAGAVTPPPRSGAIDRLIKTLDLKTPEDFERAAVHLGNRPDPADHALAGELLEHADAMRQTGKATAPPPEIPKTNPTPPPEPPPEGQAAKVEPVAPTPPAPAEAAPTVKESAPVEGKGKEAHEMTLSEFRQSEMPGRMEDGKPVIDVSGLTRAERTALESVRGGFSYMSGDKQMVELPTGYTIDRARQAIDDHLSADPSSSSLERDAHRAAVEAAAKQGKIGEGINDYPDLAQKYTPAAAGEGKAVKEVGKPPVTVPKAEEGKTTGDAQLDNLIAGGRELVTEKWLDEMQAKHPDIDIGTAWSNKALGMKSANYIAWVKPEAKPTDITFKTLGNGQMVGHSSVDRMDAPQATAVPPATAAENAPRDTSRRMSELRADKPRPIDKLYGTNGPTPEQAQAHAEAMRTWNREYRKASTEHKAYLDAQHQPSTSEGEAQVQREAAEQKANTDKDQTGIEYGMGNIRKPKANPYETPTESVKPENAKRNGPMFSDRSFIGHDVIPTVQKAAEGIHNAWDSLRRTFAPQTASPEARAGSEMLRDRFGEQARSVGSAAKALAGAKWAFDGMKPEESQAFLDRMDAGQKQPTPDLQEMANKMRQLNDQQREKIRSLGKGKLEEAIENYTGRIWKDPNADGSTMARLFGRRPLEGSKSFLKQRTYPTRADARAAGLIPQFDNPIDEFMAKYIETERYYQAHKGKNELEAKGVSQYVPAGAKTPDGMRVPKDNAFTVYGPPSVEIKEAFDKSTRDGLLKLVSDLGVEHNREARIGGRGRWGYATQGTNNITTKFGGENMVLAHEAGHQLDWKMGLWQHFQDNPQRAEINNELRDLADARNMGDSKKAYTHDRAEKMANMVQAYITAPKLMDQLAPTTKRVFDKFIDDHPQIKGIRDIKPGVELGVDSTEMSTGGMVTMGRHALPDTLADVYDNHLQPGLRGNALFDAWLGINNHLNQIQLAGLFHGGMTSMNSGFNKLALGMEQLARGHPVDAALSAMKAPFEPVMGPVQGARGIKEYYKPGSTNPATAGIMDMLTKGGFQPHQEQVMQTKAINNMVQAFRQNNIFGGIARIPGAALDAISRPIMEHLVPLQKTNAAIDLMREELEKLGPQATEEQIRHAAARVVDSVDNRLGQLNYNNVFMDRRAKDMLQASMRSVGWNLGTLREVGGGVVDAPRNALSIARGKGFATHTTPFVLAMLGGGAALGALYQYLKTGEYPKELKDYFYPKTGQKDKDGNDLRVQFPTYNRDVGAALHDVHGVGDLVGNLASMASSKTSPALNTLLDLIKNKDYFGTQIADPEESTAQKIADRAKYVAKQAVPFSVSNAQRISASGGTLADQAAQQLGVTPAPKRFTQPAYQTLLQEKLSQARGEQVHTPEQATAWKAKGDIEDLLRAGKDDEAKAAFQKAKAEGVFTASKPDAEPDAVHAQVQKEIENNAKMSKFQAEIGSLDPRSTMKLYDQAPDDEKRKIIGDVYERLAHMNESTLSETAWNAYKARLGREADRLGVTVRIDPQTKRGVVTANE